VTNIGQISKAAFNVAMRIIGCPVRAGSDDSELAIRQRVLEWRDLEVRAQSDGIVRFLRSVQAERDAAKAAAAHHYADSLRERESSARYAKLLTEEQELLRRANEECDRLRSRVAALESTMAADLI
jgi:hypothetical protein